MNDRIETENEERARVGVEDAVMSAINEGVDPETIREAVEQAIQNA